MGLDGEEETGREDLGEWKNLISGLLTMEGGGRKEEGREKRKLTWPGFKSQKCIKCWDSGIKLRKWRLTNSISKQLLLLLLVFSSFLSFLPAWRVNQSGAAKSGQP
jgi:hypothetical protein